MFDQYKPTTLSDVKKALNKLESIDRPNSDNEGMPINSPDVYNFLPASDQEKVDDAELTTKKYLQEKGKRGVTELNKSGFTTSFGPSQYDPDSNDGTVTVGEWELDISDQ